MSAGYSKARHDISDRFLPQVQQIVGPRLLVKAPLEIDLREATDLMTVLKSGDFRLAVRVRTPGIFDIYPNDFTVRSWIEDGFPSELSKIGQGYGDWMFYGHALTESERDGFRNWRLLNLDAVRIHYCQRHDRRIKTSEFPNRDGKTRLRSFDVTSFPNDDPKLLIAEGPSCPSCESVLKQEVGAGFIHSWCARAAGHFDSWRALNGGKLFNSGARLLNKR